MAALNAPRMREINRALILNYVRQSPVTRTELAERTGLTRAAISQVVADLIAAGIVVEGHQVEKAGAGRRQVKLFINLDAMYFGGVCLNRGSSWVGLINLRGDLIAEEQMEADFASADEGVDRFAWALDRQIARAGVPRERVRSVGIAAPGPVDYRNGVVRNPPNFALWHGYPLAQALSMRTGLRAVLDNISVAQAIEQKYLGAGRELSDFMVINFNDGIGSAIVLGGQLYRGARGQGSEIGHASIDMNGPQCACGNQGCLERYAAIDALLRDSPFADWKQVVDSYQESVQARRIVFHMARYLSTAIVNAMNLLDLQRVILTGDVAYRPDELLQLANRMVSARSIGSLQEKVIVAGPQVSLARTAAMPAFVSIYGDNEKKEIRI